MKKTFKTILAVIAALAFILMCSESPEGGASWANFAGMGVLALCCRGLERMCAFDK